MSQIEREREMMTPEQRIDEALDSVLRASGSALRHYTMQSTLDDMRKAMRQVMFESYVAGSNDAWNVVMRGGGNENN